MWDLDDIERAAGIDPDSADYHLRDALAESDHELLEQLVALRKRKGLTQQVVAERMKRDKAAVSNFERLSSDPHLSTIRRYAAAIGAYVKHDVRDSAQIESSNYDEAAALAEESTVRDRSTLYLKVLSSSARTHAVRPHILWSTQPDVTWSDEDSESWNRWLRQYRLALDETGRTAASPPAPCSHGR
ncbi:helix-turn-helix transcriptional regulator [Mycolicibacterium fluoranthenivorans]|uniref:Helix-turn-helix transcriptional regulator n=1 Tax=Mycolicibacterium fluoranthenivorans TaxID=258505 RepID=A0A7G8PAS5_9MYCO|nr:helix-turn-helix transcriptional regulator [Mycolicibacterium fluoranthenivorans]QNJ91441.1 helix-turn-helix transcriptional regulator [Mycolicibacterium fluoranthenivorans]